MVREFNVGIDQEREGGTGSRWVPGVSRVERRKA